MDINFFVVRVGLIIASVTLAAVAVTFISAVSSLFRKSAGHDLSTENS